jgi:hypothetical protein
VFEPVTVKHNKKVVMMIPPFEPSGILPPGIHHATWEEVVNRFGGNAHRQQLLNGLAHVVAELQRINCPTLYLDGSFVTDKPFPNDYDACWFWDLADADTADKLALLLLDTTTEGRAKQKAHYGGEVFLVHSHQAHKGQGVFALFQTDRETGAPKGIIGIDLRASP